MEFLITTIVAVILLVGVVSSCPTGCRCVEINGTFVYCRYRKLNTIPTGFPRDTRTLWLNNNNISKIEDYAFNNISTITALWLEYNHISVIEENTFNNLTSLDIVTLHHNDISVIEENAFNNLPNLQFLDMDDNNISYVSGRAFVNLPRLITLKFDMHCGGCHNVPFWKWLKLGHTFVTIVTCNDFGERKLSSLQQNDFIGCPDVPTVQVQQPSYSVTTGNSVTLVCTVSSDLTITNVQWQRNISGSITTINSNTNTNKCNGSTTTIPSLTIFSAASSDVGTYTCFASNSVGTGQSTTTTLSVTGTNDGNGSMWCSRHGDWTYLVCMFSMISLQYIMSNI